MSDVYHAYPRNALTLTDGATITAPDCKFADQFIVTLGAAGRTMPNPVNPAPGQTIRLIIKQDATGSRTITTWGSAYRFIGGSTGPTLSAAANAIDVLTMQYNDADATWNQTVSLAKDANGPNAGGGIGGSTGSTDKAILRANGVGGATAQSSAWTIDDAGLLGTTVAAASGKTILKIDNGANQPQFTFEIGNSSVFLGEIDTTMSFGFNCGSTGAVIDSRFAAAAFQSEGNYVTGDGHIVEIRMAVVTAAGTTRAIGVTAVKETDYVNVTVSSSEFNLIDRATLTPYLTTTTSGGTIHLTRPLQFNTNNQVIIHQMDPGGVNYSPILQLDNSGSNGRILIGVWQTPVIMRGDVGVGAGWGNVAGGNQSVGLKFGTSTDFGIFWGAGAPTISAFKGSLYLRTDGTGVSDRMYVNTNGSTTWTAVTTAA